MAGPTPVSALIHAATMVTAGVYMIARSNALYRSSPHAMMVVAIIGAVTALFAATIGVRQNDIKKVLAYSTVSQLGFMFIGVGVGAFTAGHLPPRHARLLQGLPLPRLRLGDSRHERRAGHPQDGRPVEEDPDHGVDVSDRHARDRRLPAARRILLEGRDPRLRGGRRRTFRSAQSGDLAARHDRRAVYRVLHVPALLPDLHRRVSRHARAGASHPRVAVDDDDSSDRAGGAFDRRRRARHSGGDR